MMKDEDRQRDLIKRTKELAPRVIKCFCALPKSTEAQILGKQLLRSGTSGGANTRATAPTDGETRRRGPGRQPRRKRSDYRGAQRSRSKAEYISKTGDCLKKLDETAFWHPSQKIQELADGGLELTLHLSSLHEIEPWVFSWGEPVCVTGPAELKKRIRNRLEASLR